jgi:hypothetical protein
MTGRTVILHIRRFEGGVMVEVRDKADGEVLLTEPLRHIADWLGVMRYEYVPGTNAEWVRK